MAKTLVNRDIRKLLKESTQPHEGTLLPEHRRALLELLNTTVTFSQTKGPLMAILPRYIASFYPLLVREGDHLEVPTY